jgi:tetratricopeptide (TPR) repeat protein
MFIFHPEGFTRHKQYRKNRSGSVFVANAYANNVLRGIFTAWGYGHALRRSRMLIVILLLIVPAHVQAMASDKVTLAMGNEQRTFQCEVVTETLSSVKLRDEYGKQMPEFRGDNVVSIEWDIPGYEWRYGLSELSAGNYEVSSTIFKSLVDDLLSFRAVVRPFLLLKYGESLYCGNKTVEALSVLEGLLDGYPNSRYVRDAADLLANAYIEGKAPAKIAALRERLTAVGPGYADRFTLHEADALLALEKTNGAEGLFLRLLKHATDQEVRLLAELGQARCDILRGALNSAGKVAEKALKSRKATPDVMATAHMVLGQVYRYEADQLKGQDAKEKYLDAVLEFMRVYTLYPDQTRRAAEALYSAGICFKYLSMLSDYRINRRRTVAALKKVTTDYPHTHWSQDAEHMLDAVR